MKLLPDIIKESFEDKFGVAPTIVVRAPGRINLLGEHTDYNGGFVLPAAIDKAIFVGIGPRKDRLISLYSFDLKEYCEVSLDTIKVGDQEWANFILGVTHVMAKSGSVMDHGFNLCFGGDIPLGAGLSSSAAVECGAAVAINTLFKMGMHKRELALAAQRAEHEFAGVKCGIMDMYASIFGRKDQVVCLDCRNITHEYFSFPFDDYQLVLFNTKVKHSLADSAYNARRASCEKGLAYFQLAFEEIEDLRDVTREQLIASKEALEAEVYQRCDYVIGETERMVQAKEALETADSELFGELMFQTHDGLKNLYAVSCDELDFLVDTVKDIPAVIGARMMGGGFGGCTINLVAKSDLRDVIAKVENAYALRYGFKPDTIEVKLTDGCTVL